MINGGSSQKLLFFVKDEEDNAFELHCRAGICTFQSAMKFLRRTNTPDHREGAINQVIPEHIKKQIIIQCKLEGLI